MSFPRSRPGFSFAVQARDLSAAEPLGTVRAAGATTGPVRADRSDDRLYRFRVRRLAGDEANAATFHGWRVLFSVVFGVLVPAEPEPDRGG
jgi:hypothetical protein